MIGVAFVFIITGYAYILSHHFHDGKYFLTVFPRKEKAVPNNFHSAKKHIFPLLVNRDWYMCKTEKMKMQCTF